MMYYIFSNSFGAQATEWVKAEKKHLVIIIYDQGQVRNIYSGDAAFPCGYYTINLVR